MMAAQPLPGRRSPWDVAGVLVLAATGRPAPLNAIGSKIGQSFMHCTILQTESSAFRATKCTGLQAGLHAWERVVYGWTQAVLHAIHSGLLDLYPRPLGLLVHPSLQAGWTGRSAGAGGLAFLRAHAMPWIRLSL